MSTIQRDGWTFGTRDYKNVYFGYSPEGKKTLSKMSKMEKKDLIHALENGKGLDFQDVIPKFGVSNKNCLSTVFKGKKYFVKHYDRSANMRRKSTNGYNEFLALYKIKTELSQLNGTYGNKNTKIDIIEPIYGSVNLIRFKSIIIYPFIEKMKIFDESSIHIELKQMLEKINQKFDRDHEIWDIGPRNINHKIESNGTTTLAIFDPTTDIETPEFHKLILNQ